MSIEVEIQALNAAGNSILLEVAVAFRYAITSGETSPFNTTIWEELLDLDHCTVTIVSQNYSEIERAQFEIRGVVLTTNELGDYTQISGEIINNGNHSVQLNSIAAAIFDAQGKLLSTDKSFELIHYLFPGESGPFRVSIITPTSSQIYISENTFYPDARLASSKDDYEINFLEEQNYTNGGGNVHLVGILQDDSAISLNISLVAGIYDQANNMLHADPLSRALNALAPVGSLAYDFDSWQLLNDNQGLLGQADSYSVQWNPYWTQESSTNCIAITTSDVKIKYDDLSQEMIFTGKIVNNEDQTVSSSVVIIMLQDKETDRLIARGSVPSFDSIPT